MLDDYEFALCLTHDVDRVHKTYQIPYYAAKECSLYHLKTALPSHKPYWQFEEVIELEDELGVRSAFYFLNEPHLFREKSPRNWLRPSCWVEHFGRYDVTSPEMMDVIRRLDDGGWEVGLHGSFDSYDDRERLAYEKGVLERILGHEVTGGRQHWLHMTVPKTWQHHVDIGLNYDASLGSSTEYGFHHGYDPIRPFDDEFVVFPLTVMEVALGDATSSLRQAQEECERLLHEARENDAVMTILWHPRYFNDREFPDYCELYRTTIERALELGAWVGPPGELYEELDTARSDPNSRAGRTDVPERKHRITK